MDSHTDELLFRRNGPLHAQWGKLRTSRCPGACVHRHIDQEVRRQVLVAVNVDALQFAGGPAAY